VSNRASGYRLEPEIKVNDFNGFGGRLEAPSEIEDIDRELLDAASAQFQKVAAIVGRVWSKRKDQPLPDVFYAQRVIRLVKLGKLEAQGDLRRMRYSEVRRARG
jgi:Protein of unknown function